MKFRQPRIGESSAVATWTFIAMGAFWLFAGSCIAAGRRRSLDRCEGGLGPFGTASRGSRLFLSTFEPLTSGSAATPDRESASELFSFRTECLRVGMYWSRNPCRRRVLCLSRSVSTNCPKVGEFRQSHDATMSGDCTLNALARLVTHPLIRRLQLEQV